MTQPPDNSWCKKGGPRGYITTRPLPWKIGRKDSEWEFVVPVGKEFESSVPAALRWVFDPDDPFFLKSAAIHDTLLETGYRQAFADSQWFEAALSVHANATRTWLAYSAKRARRFWKWVFQKFSR